MQVTARLFATAFALLLAPLPMLAQDDFEMGTDEYLIYDKKLVRYTRLDVNADGVLTYDEILVGYPRLNEWDFHTIDQNDDFLVDPAELAAGQKSGLLLTEG